MVRPGARLPLVLLGLLTAPCARPAYADYKEAFKKGWESADQGNWAEAIRLMEQAVAEKPMEGEPVRFYGQRYEGYYPHYWLGLARAKSGDCVKALAAFDASESQGAIQKSSLYSSLVKSRQSCIVKAAPAPSPSAGPDAAAVARAAQEAEGAINRAAAESRGLDRLRSDPLLAGVWAQETPLGPSQNQAHDRLSSARAKLESARKKADLAQLAEAKDLAERALGEFQTVKAHALRRRAEGGATPTPLTFTPTPKGPPSQLVNAARAFFGAEYKQAVDILQRAEPAGGPAAVHGLLLRSAARHALYFVGGEKDQSLLKEARADARICRQLAPDLRLDPSAFSPSFIQFFSEAR